MERIEYQGTEVTPKELAKLIVIRALRSCEVSSDWPHDFGIELNMVESEETELAYEKQLNRIEKFLGIDKIRQAMANRRFGSKS